MYLKMTELQKSYLMLKEEEVKGETGINLYVEFRYKGQIKDLEEAFSKVIASQPMLRAKIFDSETFLIENNLDYKIEVINSHCYEQLVMERKRREISKIKYKACDYPLFTMESIGQNENFRVMFSVDHMIADSLSLLNLVQQLKLFLSDPQMAVYDYSDELVRMQDYYQEKRNCVKYEISKDYDINKMQQIYPAPQINYQNEQITDIDYLHKESTINRELYARLKDKVERLSFSVTDLLLTAYIFILYKWSKEQKLSVVFNLHNRLKDGNSFETIGNFTSQLLLQTSFDFEKSFIDNMKKVKVSLVDASRYNYYEVSEILSEMKKKPASAAIPIGFTSMLADEKSNLFLDLFDLEDCIAQNPLMYLDFQARNMSGELNIVWNYRSDMFESTIIDTMFTEYCSLIHNFLYTDEDILSIYNRTKKSKLLVDYKCYNAQTNNVNFHFDTLREHFEKISEKYPEKTFAIVDNSEYTFSHIYTLAAQKAVEIKKIKKIYGKRKVRIAINGKKNINSITCILAAILANDSFCVINEHFKDEKMKEILESLQNYIFYNDGKLIEVSDTDTLIDTEESYILHTSGTTGQPKGIIITEKAALNTVYDIILKYSITEKDTVMNISNLYFDLSIFDIFGAIVSGMSIVFVDVFECGWFFKYNYNNEITIWNSTPALANEYLLKYDFEKLRGILVSGDFVPKKMIKELYSKYGSATLFALGGATESSIWSNYYDCSSYENVSPIPYGLPLANQRLYVINEKGGLCDLRVLGEICIAGDGLAKGYLSDEQTKESFVWNEDLGETIYKTGDLGYLGSDHLIYIVGRVTSEIKHNGYRIDLREIEKYINRNPDVSNSVAFIKKIENGRTRLVCAVVSSNPSDIKKKIRSELSKKLPLYMLPNNILVIPEIPLTGNGKVDIKHLCSMS